MSWQQLSIAVTPEEHDALEELLWGLGAVSVTYTDAQDQPVLEPAPGETRLWEHSIISALFPADAATDELQQLLNPQLSNPASMHWTSVAEQNWERAWMDDFKPMRYGQRLWVCPTGYTPPEPQAINIRLDPGLAFGSGSHTTTRLCLEWLDGADLQGKTLLDFGCGSGVLAIAGLLLGAGRAYGVDIDPQALTASRDNAERNQVSAALELALADHWQAPEPIDILMANILSGPLCELASHFADMQSADARLVLSGILSEQSQEVIHAYSRYYRFDPVQILDGWVRLDGHRLQV